MSYKDPIKERIAKNLSQRRRREQLRTLIINYFSNHMCVDCGESDPVVLDFDHIRGEKTANISNLVNNRVKWEKILEEIDKCEVRCSNCHRRKTAKQLGYWKNIK